MNLNSTDGEGLTRQTAEELVEQLAEEFIERHRQGESPRMEDYITAHPELGDEIRDLFPMIAALEGCRLDDSAEASSSAVAGFDCPQQLGEDLQLVREIGRGGMGIVYEAVQQSLGRRVAVKVLPHQVFFDNKKLERFRREARAAGAINHPNVVTVYSVGQQSGLHYLVMPLIEGVALDELIETMASNSTAVGGENNTNDLSRSLARALVVNDFSNVVVAERVAPSPTPRTARHLDPTVEFSGSGDSKVESLAGNPTLPLSLQDATPPVLLPQAITCDTYWHSAARIIQQAADALAHAHAAGTLHRDIKPGNLMVDRKGNAWVTDFGLAKALQQNDLSQHDLSMTGEVVGTLRYMAPEQLNGETDQRSDIYSLGLTLYELLCLRPAFTSQTPSKLIREITTVPPPSPRKLNPAVPRDLETITLKAIAITPEERYQSSAELAADLTRFLEAKPVSVAPATKLQTYQAWRRRNPLVAGLIAAVILLSLTTMIGIGAFLNAPPPGPPRDFPGGPPASRKPSAGSAELPSADSREGQADNGQRSNERPNRPPHYGPDGRPQPPPHHFDEAGRHRPPRPGDHPPGTHPPPRRSPDGRRRPQERGRPQPPSR